MLQALGSFEELPAMQIRCPHCHHPIEVADEKLLDELTCPSCGSNVTLVSKETRIDGDETRLGSTVGIAMRQLGHFALLEQVGLGGFGAVWKARDTVLDRLVAIKVPRRGQLNNSEAEYFLRDARAAAQLRHPNIVSVHEVGRDGETLFIASDYVEGANLHEWLEARKLTIREAAELVAQISEAVQHAHERGIVHRDLKPGNILIDYAGRPHVTDFGLAKRESGEITMTMDGQILGTPAYMSPEQARGKAHEADAQSDVYSLGVILFELLTGELPFRGEKRMLIVQILNDEPPSPRRLNSRVPRDLETICLKCLQKEPKKRYPTAAELANDLLRFAVGDPISARPIGRLERGWRWCRRNPLLAGLEAAFVCVLLSAATTSTWLAMRASANERVAAERLVDANRARAQLAAQTNQLRARVYAGQVLLANVSMTNGQVVQARELLDATEPNLRGWEYDRLKWLADSARQTVRLPETSRSLYSLAVSSDRNRLATASSDGQLRIWELASGQLLKAVTAHAGRRGVLDVVYSRDGKKLLTSGATDCDLKLWDAEKLDLLQSFPGHSQEVWAIDMSPDQQLVASGGRDRTIRIWDVATGACKHTWNAHDGCIWSVQFSPDQESLVSASQDGTAKIWKLASGEVRHVLRGHASEVDCAVYRSDGLQIATCSDDKSIRLWDAESGAQQRILTGHTDWVRRIDYCDNSPYLASVGRDATVRIWDVEQGTAVVTLRGHEGYVRDVETFLTQQVGNPLSGLTVVTGGDDALVKTWELGRHPEVWRLMGSAGQVRSVAISPDGSLVAAIDMFGRLVIWNARDGLLRGAIEIAESGADVVFIPNSRLVVVGTTVGTLVACDVDSGDSQVFPSSAESRSGISALAARGDGRQFAVVGRDGKLTVWDAIKRSVLFELTLRSNADPSVEGLCVAYVPRADRIVCGCSDGSVRILNADNGELIRSFRLHEMPVVAVAAAVDGKIASRGAAGKVLLWNGTTGAIEHEFKDVAGLDGKLVFSPDGHRLVAGTVGGEIKLWDANTGIELLLLTPPQEQIGDYERNTTGIAFSPNGKSIISGHADGLVRLWRTVPPPATVNEPTATPFHKTADGIRRIAAASNVAAAAAAGAKGNWSDATTALKKSLQTDPESHFSYLQLASLLALAGDQSAYRKHVDAMLRRWGTTTDPLAADRTVKASVLLPGAPAEWERLESLIELALADKSNLYWSWFALTKSMLAYRCDQFDGAKSWAQLSQKDSPGVQVDAPAKYIIAMSEFRLGRTDEAHAVLDTTQAEYRDVIPAPTNGQFGAGWHDWLILMLWQNEAVRLIDTNGD